LTRPPAINERSLPRRADDQRRTGAANGLDGDAYVIPWLRAT
jgi:hypothetical protein